MAALEATIVVGKDLPKRFKAARADARRIMRSEIGGAQLLFAQLGKANVERNFTRRTGGLEHVAINPIRETSAGFEGSAGWTVVYAQAHEKGGTIHAKNVQNLTIPLSAILTKRGVPRGTAHDVISNPGSYGFDGTFFRTHILFGKQSGKAVPLFKLQPSVTLPAKPFAEPALKAVQPVFEAKLHSAMQALFVGA